VSIFFRAVCLMATRTFLRRSPGYAVDTDYQTYSSQSVAPVRRYASLSSFPVSPVTRSPCATACAPVCAPVCAPRTRYVDRCQQVTNYRYVDIPEPYDVPVSVPEHVRVPFRTIIPTCSAASRRFPILSMPLPKRILTDATLNGGATLYYFNL